MKKILLIILSFVIFSNVFAGVKDETNTLDFKAIRRLERVVERIENSKNVKIYINIFDGEESFQPADPQKSVIFNIQKINKEEIGVELKFSEDLDMESKSVELGVVMDHCKKNLYEEKYEEYINCVLESIDKIIASDEKEMEEEKKEIKEEKSIEK